MQVFPLHVEAISFSVNPIDWKQRGGDALHCLNFFTRLKIFNPAPILVLLFGRETVSFRSCVFHSPNIMLSEMTTSSLIRKICRRR
jgi:hypothetical protein